MRAGKADSFMNEWIKQWWKWIWKKKCDIDREENAREWWVQETQGKFRKGQRGTKKKRTVWVRVSVSKIIPMLKRRRAQSESETLRERIFQGESFPCAWAQYIWATNIYMQTVRTCQAPLLDCYLSDISRWKHIITAGQQWTSVGYLPISW